MNGGMRRAAGAGAIAACVWAALEPLDRRLVGNDYSDVAVLGKAVTRSAAWPLAGLVVHAANGAVFGVAFELVRRRVDIPPRRLALGMALAEHLTLFRLGRFVDAYHPARGRPGVVSVAGPRAFVQATGRHALFGFVLGRLSG